MTQLPEIVSQATNHEQMRRRNRAHAITRRAMVVVPPMMTLIAAAMVAGRFVEPWVWMWLLAGAIYFACKWMALIDAIADDDAGGAVITLRRAGAFMLLWPGMDARPFFEEMRTEIRRPAQREWINAVAKLLLGVSILMIALPRLDSWPIYARGWAGMVGLIFVLHFGIFHLLALFWRRRGIEVEPIMDSPARSRSLGEFWGRRWNRAFRDVAHRFIFAPLRLRLGASGASVIVFIASALAHEIVISLPARGGYGGPTLFFAIQAIAMRFERSRLGRSIGLRRGVRGRGFTIACLIVPAPLLFHPPFVREVIAPFLQAIGAW